MKYFVSYCFRTSGPDGEHNRFGNRIMSRESPLASREDIEELEYQIEESSSRIRYVKLLWFRRLEAAEEEERASSGSGGGRMMSKTDEEISKLIGQLRDGGAAGVEQYEQKLRAAGWRGKTMLPQPDIYKRDQGAKKDRMRRIRTLKVLKGMWYLALFLIVSAAAAGAKGLVVGLMLGWVVIGVLITAWGRSEKARMPRMRVRMRTNDPTLISISPDYRDSDKKAIVEQLVKHRVDWPNIQMSLGEFLRRADEVGVSSNEAMHYLVDERIPFTVDFKGPESVLSLAQPPIASDIERKLT